MLTAITALLALLLVVELLRTRVAASHTSDVIEAMEKLAFIAAAPAPPTPDDVLADLIAHRYIVTTKAEGMFGGVLVGTRVITTPGGQHLVVYSFDQCSTLPQHEGDTPSEIAGRVILDSSGISYLQQVG